MSHNRLTADASSALMGGSGEESSPVTTIEAEKSGARK